MRCQIPCRQAAVWVRKELIVMNNTHSEAATETPFDTAKLDRLMGEADLDVLVVTSRHNVQYLLGGYRFFFFDVMDAIGVSRYLPVVVYQKGRPEIHSMSAIAWRVSSVSWKPFGADRQDVVLGTLDATETAVKHIKQLGDGVGEWGLNLSFLPLTPDNFLVPNSAMWNCAMHNSSLSGCARSRRQQRSSLCVMPPPASSAPCRPRSRLANPE